MNYKAIDWNAIEDMIDKLTWEKLTEQYWSDTRIPLSNDLDDWATLPYAEKDMVAKVFGGLTLLDTLQSQDGLQSLKDAILSQHEEAVLNNIQFMESMHAKSYSAIFSTLNTKSEIEDIFKWTNSNNLLHIKPIESTKFITTVLHWRRRLHLFFLSHSFSILDFMLRFTILETISYQTLRRLSS